MPMRDLPFAPEATSLDDATLQRRLAWRRGWRLAVSGALFLCSAIAALFAVILAFGTLLALASGQYVDDATGLAFALTWDATTLVCAVCTWRAAARPTDA